METLTYCTRRSELLEYFDRTALEAWAQLTSDAPVNRIRATVRLGRDEMRRTLLGWLPSDLKGMRVLDAGCGTGAFSVEAARRGALVTAIDLSPKLIQIAQKRSATEMAIDFRVGDFLENSLGHFDYVTAMDSLIHYRSGDMVEVLRRLSEKADRAFLFTFAPRTVALAGMHAVGKLFPRADRAPAIEPVRPREIISSVAKFEAYELGRTHRVASGFYISQAVELRRR